jgi:hypothetical protein
VVAEEVDGDVAEGGVDGRNMRRNCSHGFILPWGSRRDPGVFFAFSEQIMGGEFAVGSPAKSGDQ